MLDKFPLYANMDIFQCQKVSPLSKGGNISGPDKLHFHAKVDTLKGRKNKIPLNVTVDTFQY